MLEISIPYNILTNGTNRYNRMCAQKRQQVVESSMTCNSTVKVLRSTPVRTGKVYKRLMQAVKIACTAVYMYKSISRRLCNVYNIAHHYELLAFMHFKASHPVQTIQQHLFKLKLSDNVKRHARKATGINKPDEMWNGTKVSHLIMGTLRANIGCVYTTLHGKNKGIYHRNLNVVIAPVEMQIPQ